MAKVTRIKAKDSDEMEVSATSKKGSAGAGSEKAGNSVDSEATITRKKVVVKDKESKKNKRKERKAAEKKVTSESAKVDGVSSEEKKPFILIRPIVYFFRYLRDSWKELRQVRWPNRKTTWGMVFAVLVYTAAFMALISVLDLLFKWLFSLILGN